MNIETNIKISDIEFADKYESNFIFLTQKIKDLLTLDFPNIEFYSIILKKRILAMETNQFHLLFFSFDVDCNLTKNDLIEKNKIDIIPYFF